MEEQLGPMTTMRYLAELKQAFSEHFPDRSWGWITDMQDSLGAGEKVQEYAAFAKEMRRCGDGIIRTLERGRIDVPKVVAPILDATQPEAQLPAATPPRDALNTQEQHVVVFGAAIQTTGLLHSVVQPTQTEVPPVTTPLAEPPVDGSDTPSVPMNPVVPPLAQDNDGLTFPDTLF